MCAHKNILYHGGRVKKKKRNSIIFFEIVFVHGGQNGVDDEMPHRVAAWRRDGIARQRVAGAGGFLLLYFYHQQQQQREPWLHAYYKRAQLHTTTSPTTAFGTLAVRATLQSRVW